MQSIFIVSRVYLISGTDIVLSATNVDTVGDIRRLLLDGHQQVQGLVIESWPWVIRQGNTHTRGAVIGRKGGGGG